MLEESTGLTSNSTDIQHHLIAFNFHKNNTYFRYLHDLQGQHNAIVSNIYCV